MIARFTIGLMLLVGVVCAAEPRQDVFAVRQGEMWRFNSQVQSKVKELPALGALPRVNFNPQAPFPLVKPGETVVVSDAGMYFDNQSSCLLYVGNVRLNNERVRVRTAQRLYVLLPENRQLPRQSQQRGAFPNLLILPNRRRIKMLWKSPRKMLRWMCREMLLCWRDVAVRLPSPWSGRQIRW